jgi:hypothetical protein
MFPDMQSINTTKLNELREFASAQIGPGSYALATERDGRKS